MVANEMVRKPAKVPKPNMATKKMAYRISWSDARDGDDGAADEDRSGSGAMLRAAPMPTGIDSGDAGDGGAHRHGEAFLQADHDVVGARR